MSHSKRIHIIRVHQNIQAFADNPQTQLFHVNSCCFGWHYVNWPKGGWLVNLLVFTFAAFVISNCVFVPVMQPHLLLFIVPNELPAQTLRAGPSCKST